jgi:hypothetical protein
MVLLTNKGLVYRNMTQAQPQFQRPLPRIGSILFIAGMVIAIVSTAIHPSTEDPSNHSLVFVEYANEDSWIALKIRIRFTF